MTVPRGSSVGSAATILSATGVPLAVVVPLQYAVAMNVIGPLTPGATDGRGEGDRDGVGGSDSDGGGDGADEAGGAGDTDAGGVCGDDAGWIRPAHPCATRRRAPRTAYPIADESPAPLRLGIGPRTIKCHTDSEPVRVMPDGLRVGALTRATIFEIVSVFCRRSRPTSGVYSMNR